MSLVRLPCQPEGQTLGAAHKLTCPWQESHCRWGQGSICNSKNGSIRPRSGLYVSMGKLKKVSAYFRITRWGPASGVISVMSDTHGAQRRERSVVPGTGSRRWCSCFADSHASLVPAFIICPCFRHAGFTTGSIQKFAASPTLKAESSKNNILRMGWAWKRCQRASWPRGAWTPLVQQIWCPFSLRMHLPLRLQKGPL